MEISLISRIICENLSWLHKKNFRLTTNHLW
jgi:hypothetical protein